VTPPLPHSDLPKAVGFTIMKCCLDNKQKVGKLGCGTSSLMNIRLMTSMQFRLSLAKPIRLSQEAYVHGWAVIRRKSPIMPPKTLT